MITIALILAYDGELFFGWQKSEGRATIEQTLTNVLEQILQQPIQLQAASRTDRGVHAEGQLVSCQIKKCNLEALHKSLNRLLPPTIRVYKIEEKEEGFHATLAATGKCYLYQLYHHSFCPPQLHRTHWHIYTPLDLSLMRKASRHLLGTHDFSAFCNQQENGKPEADKVRTLFSVEIIEKEPHRYAIEVTGNRFLYKMMRNIVGLLVEIGQGKRSVDEIVPILQSKQRLLAGVTAPAHGLTLKEVLYDRKK